MANLGLILPWTEAEERTLAQEALLYIRALEQVDTAAFSYSPLEHLREDNRTYFLPLLNVDELKKIRAAVV
jgi:hypothetical protein